MCEAPDYGHMTTSEAYSYWLWLEAMYGRYTQDWSKLEAAWDNMEKYIIPVNEGDGNEEQPTMNYYNPQVQPLMLQNTPTQICTLQR
ncbi:glycoside hydrolase family 48 protein [Bacillus licheniformis]|nr:glycoside hydrolase family 48 protein [Bacillus licheniformis]